MSERAIFFEITNACNHKCIHCCKQWEDNLQVRTADKIMLDKIISLPKSHLTISGGEPSLVKEQVFYLINHEKSSITINTNLTNWTVKDIEYINKKRKVDFNISVVSLQRDVYKQIVCADTYNKFFNNLRLIHKNSCITMVINNTNINSIHFTIKNLLLMGFYNILVTPQTPTPNDSVDVPLVVSIVQKLHNKYKNIAHITTQGFCSSKYCDHICEAGIGRLLIDTKGDVYPCAPIHKPCKLGTINTDINILKQKGIDFYYSYPQELQKVCKGFLL